MVLVTEVVSESEKELEDIAEEPYACVVSSQFLSQCCSACFKRSETLRRCSKCQFLYFCGPECQKKGWETHREECGCLERVSPRKPTDMARLMARIIFKRKKDSHYSTHSPAKEGRSFDDLMSHKEEIRKDGSRSDHFHTLLFVLKEFLGEYDLPTVSDLFDIFGKIVVNAFSILDTDLNPVGTGLYLRLSQLDHSCNPDCVVVFSGPTAILRPLKSGLDLSSLAQIRMSYIDLLAPSSERRRQLSEQYYFHCLCTPCTNKEKDMEMEAFKCQACWGPVSNFTQDEKERSCRACGKSFGSLDAGVECSQRTKWTLETFEELKKSNDLEEIFNKCEELLETQGRLLYRLNVYRVRTMDFMFDACLELQRWERAAQLGLEILDAYRLYYPSNYPNVVLQMAKVGKLLLYLEKADRQTELLLEEAVRMGELCFGRDHANFLQIENLLNDLREERKVIMCGLQKLKN